MLLTMSFLVHAAAWPSSRQQPYGPPTSLTPISTFSLLTHCPCCGGGNHPCILLYSKMVIHGI